MGTVDPQAVTGWTNQQDMTVTAYLDTDLSGLSQGVVTKADLVTAVQTSLGLADSAYQLPGTGVPSTDMTTAVQTSLGLANAAVPATSILTYAWTSEFLLNGSPAGVFRTNMRRHDAGTDLTTLSTGVMTAVAIPLYAGDVVTDLTFVSGATAANTPTAWWFALYSNAATPALLQQTADQTNTAWAAHTATTLALAAPVTISTTGVYYAACMVTATGCPTLAGATVQVDAAGAVVTGMKVLANTSGTTLTTTAPATIATPTTIGTVPLVIAK